MWTDPVSQIMSKLQICDELLENVFQIDGILARYSDTHDDSSINHISKILVLLYDGANYAHVHTYLISHVLVQWSPSLK